MLGVGILLSVVDFKGLEFLNLLSADRTLPISLYDHFSAVTTSRYVLAWLCDCVLFIGQADYTFFTLTTVCAIRVKTVSFFENDQAMWRHYFLPDQSYRVA